MNKEYLPSGLISIANRSGGWMKCIFSRMRYFSISQQYTDVMLSICEPQLNVKIEAKFCSAMMCSASLALVTLSAPISALAAEGRSYNTTKALVEVNDPKADRNPVRSFAAPGWKAVDVKAKVNLRSGQDIAIVCEGKFPLGIIADDLYRQSGEFNRSFVITRQTTVLDLCNQMEDNARRQSPHLFK